MRLPSSSSIIFATLAVSASSPALAAPTGENTDSGGLASSSSNQNFHARRPSISVGLGNGEYGGEELRVNLRRSDEEMANIAARGCGGPLGKLLGPILGPLPAVGEPLNKLIDTVEGTLGLCKPAGAASVKDLDDGMVDMEQLQHVAQAVAKAVATASFEYSPPSSSTSDTPTESSGADALGIPDSGSSAPPNTPAMPSSSGTSSAPTTEPSDAAPAARAVEAPIAIPIKVNPPALPVQPPVAIPGSVALPVNPGDVTGKLPVSPGDLKDKLPVQPPVSPGDVTGKLPIQPPVQPPIRRSGVSPGDVTSKLPVNPGDLKDKLPIQPPVTPGDVTGKLPVSLPVNPGDVKNKLPVSPPVSPGDILDKLPVSPPIQPPGGVTRRGVAAAPREEYKESNPSTFRGRRWASRDAPAPPAGAPKPPSLPLGVPTPPSPPVDAPAPPIGLPSLPVGVPSLPIAVPGPVKTVKDKAPVQPPVRRQDGEDDGYDDEDCYEGENCDNAEDGYDG